jgi:beta-glucosidase
LLKKKHCANVIFMITQTLDWNEYIATARKAIAEGCVLLKNTNNVLPLATNSHVAVFGRMQNNYYKSGTGSGGLVNVTKVTNIMEGLKDSGSVILDDELIKIYEDWEKENPYEEGIGWGKEHWSQKEMEVSKDLANRMAKKNDYALVIIGRTAGEDKDNKDESGSYKLAKTECNMIATVRKAFKKVIVILNVGNIIDMSFVKKYNPDSVMYVWQGGMIGGLGTADVLTGKVSPSGKLTDTIAYDIKDYPAYKNFGNPAIAVYEEDIFVGYRYFETFAQNKVLYPFGFGLSYTTFESKFAFTNDKENLSITVKATVKNTGKAAGKDVVQAYVSLPQGKLGKPSRVLAAFAKTKELSANETQELTLNINLKDFASFDDTGLTGNKSCSVLEDGIYEIFAGSDVRSATSVGSLTLDRTFVVEHLHQAMAPVQDIRRLKATQKTATSKVAADKEVVKASPKLQTSHRLSVLSKVQEKYQSNTLSFDGKQFEISDEDLVKIVRGEGMGSPKVTPGTAAAFGGVTKNLQKYGIPCGCCDDGPSGMRFDSGAQAFSLPIGTMLACSYNTELVEKLYTYTALEMIYNKVDILLGPGINIHRYPLNGRNFEYFSEDPFVTGMFACAVIRGLHTAGVTGSLKHFCANNQELGRRTINSVVSERALREIYLKGYEIAVKQANADCIMTTYGAVNGIWTAGNYDLSTIILREEWGFKGIVMTDWWAPVNDENSEPKETHFASMIRAQNDIYMACSDAESDTVGDDTLESLRNGSLTRAELLRAAQNILDYLEKSHTLKRQKGTDDKIEIINRPASASEEQTSDIIYYILKPNETLSVPTKDIKVKKGATYTFAIDVQKPAVYSVKLTAKSDAEKTAQMPVSVFTNGILRASYVWNGTENKEVVIDKQMGFFSKYNIVKMYFAQGGLDLVNIEFTYSKELPPVWG